MSDFLDALGLKSSVLAAGLAGGVLRALSRRRYSLREVVASPICGALAAAYLTPTALYYAAALGVPMPPPDQSAATTHAAAFLIGASGMWLSDLLFMVVTDRIAGRLGRNPAPPPS